MISHGDDRNKINTILRWNEQWQPVKKVTVKKNVGHRGDINRCWYLVTSGHRTPEGEGERSQMIGWDPKTEVGPPPSAEIDSKKDQLLERARGRQTHCHLLWVEDKRIFETRGTQVLQASIKNRLKSISP